MLPYFGDSIGNLVIPQDKHWISEFGWNFIMLKTDIKYSFCDKIIGVILTCYELTFVLMEKRHEDY
jgi:hypothetical protein